MALGELLEFPDRHGGVVTVDAALRVVVSGAEGYIDGNVHTFRGRFGVWYPDDRFGTSTSLDEIDSMTDDAATWIAGFLAGNEPDLFEYLGVDARVDVTVGEVDRWRAFLERFRRSGYCPQMGLRPDGPLQMTPDERAELRIEGEPSPWAYAGERVWIPSGPNWVEADPQPDLVDEQLAGTLCAERGHPDLMQLQSGWSICLDCAQVRPD